MYYSDNFNQLTAVTLDQKGAWLVTYKAAGLYIFNCTIYGPSPEIRTDLDTVVVNVIQGKYLLFNTTGTS